MSDTYTPSTDEEGRPSKKRCLSPSATSEIPPSSAKKATYTTKCSKCQKRLGRKSCTQKACIKCCTDKNCEGHRDVREKEDILNGQHIINKIADAKRALKIQPGVFRDPAFQYLGESILIWSLRDYMSNSKWRDDAIRKSLRNIESRKQALMVEKEAERRRREKTNSGTDGNGDNKDDDSVQEKEDSNKSLLPKHKKENRKQRFMRIMEELYERSKAEN